jgi:uncharacterized membrane protein
MRRLDSYAEAASVRLSRTQITPSLAETSRRALFLLLTRTKIHPVTLFVLLSLTFGSAIAVVVPPLRGPDEIAHFLRIHSYARGELLPPAEVDGRKGIFVERELYNQLYFFRAAGEWFVKERDQGVRYGQIMAAYRSFGGRIEDEVNEPTAFMPFAGTEGYNPVAYIPYIIAEGIGRLLRLKFPDRLLLIRLFGLVTFTAVAAYAIAVTPALKWAFVLIALLPVSLYNRSVLSADGAALGSALMITALCLRSAQNGDGRLWERSLWMTLCALSKQPQIVFILLELMVSPLKELPRRWRSIAIVALPCLVLSPLWVVAVSGEMGAWRLQLEEQHPPEHFDPLWKLLYMWDHPWHFPLATWTALSGWGDRLWLELIGILGWQDILLRPWIYVVLTVCLALAALQKLQVDGATRARVVVMTGLTVLSYVTLVYLIFYLTYTPLDVDHVRGVQGRYFVVILPVAAIFISSMINRDVPYGMSAVVATAGSMISGFATIEALVRAHW